MLVSGVACSSGANPPPKAQLEASAPDNAHVRFLNGSPDSTATGGSVTIASSSGQFVGAVAYGTLTTFFDFTRQLSADLTITSSSWSSALTCTTPFALTAGFSYTVVIAGKPTGIGNQRLQCQIFTENFATPPPGMAQLLFHHASPAAFFAGEDTLQVGTFSPAQGTFGTAGGPVASTPLGSTTFVTIVTGASPSTLTTVAAGTKNFSFAPSGQGGIGFYVVRGSATPPTPAPTAPASPEATVLPANAILGAGNAGSLPDPTNAFPVGSSTTFSIYVIDAPSGAAPPSPLPYKLIGVID